MIEDNNQPNYEISGIDDKKYNRLYIAVAKCMGFPTIDELKDIIEIVKTDFPPPPNHKDY